MAVAAAPLVIPAAEAAWAAIVFVGSALAVAIGISEAKDAVDKTFTSAVPSSTISCTPNESTKQQAETKDVATDKEAEEDDPNDKCKQLRADILEKFAKLGKELRKYDPIADAKGGFLHKHGVTKPCGHYKEITDLQRGLKNDLTRFQRQCGNSGVKIDRNVDRMANQTIERPLGC